MNQLPLLPSRAFILFISCAFFINACKTRSLSSSPTSLSFYPNKGFVGTRVLIKGKGFSTNPEENTVLFNGVKASITQASENTLDVFVPDNASSGKITVMVKGDMLQSTATFRVVYIGATERIAHNEEQTENKAGPTTPKFIAFYPKQGKTGRTVTLKGIGFSKLPESNSVQFNGVPATVIDATPTSLTVQVPQGASTGKISITTQGKTLNSQEDFTIVYLKQISATYSNLLLLQSDNTLWGLGSNIHGQLGLGPLANTSIPKEIMTDVKKVALGDQHMMLLKTDGTLWATGNNHKGQLGTGTTPVIKTPQKVMSNVQDIVCGQASTFLLKTDHSLWVCGKFDLAANKSSVNIPQKIMTEVKKLVLGEEHVFMLKTDHSLWINNSKEGAEHFSKIMDGVLTVKTKHGRTFFLKTDHSLWAYGDNWDGELGIGSSRNAIRTPQKIMTDVKEVAVGVDHTMILKRDHTLWATGRNDYGQLGDAKAGMILPSSNYGYAIIHKKATPNYLNTPKQIMTDVKTVVTGQYHTLILKTDHTLWATGRNQYGQFGDGTFNTLVSQPKQVMSEVKEVMGGATYTLILKTDHTLWTAGQSLFAPQGEVFTEVGI
ncbi:IPT/TIG domain-containing protein [Rapidithrix thailandica]|uniref:IPT/TIG domain-containing protein n=1 Tax=Rapidithrix thailandica TaxID=413964 RepID=A0AAW9S3N3_9BACT